MWAARQRTAGEDTFFVTTIAYKLSNMHCVHRKGPRHSRSPLHIQTNYFLQQAVDLACASVDLPWAIFDDARACSDSFRPSSFLDAPCFAAALVW